MSHHVIAHVKFGSTSPFKDPASTLTCCCGWSTITPDPNATVEAAWNAHKRDVGAPMKNRTLIRREPGAVHVW